MEENKGSKTTIVAVIALALALITMIAYQGEQEIVVNTGQGPTQMNTIAVMGYSEMEVEPDQAIIRFSVVTDAKTAKQAQQDNAKKMTAVFDRLKEMGVKETDIETESVYLSPKQYWDQETGKSINDGYTQTNSVKVTVHNLDSVGPVMDEMIASGANMIGGIQFDLSKEQRKKVNGQALELAAKEARGKAESLAQALGVSVGKVVSISESNYVVTPYYEEKAMMAFDMESKGAPTPVSPQKLNVNLNVNVAYEIA